MITALYEFIYLLTQCVVVFDRSIAPLWWPRLVSPPSIVMGTLLLSRQSWSIYLACSRPGWLFQVGSASRPAESEILSSCAGMLTSRCSCQYQILCERWLLRSGESLQLLDILCFVDVSGNSTGNCCWSCFRCWRCYFFIVSGWLLHSSVALFSRFVGLVFTGTCLLLSCGFKEVRFTVHVLASFTLQCKFLQWNDVHICC